MSKTKIEWCHETINPIVGCSKVSEGCQNCYAEKMAWRLKCMGNPKYQDVVDHNGWTGEIAGDMNQFHSLPKKPRKVFVVSMGDLFNENVRDQAVDMIFYAMRDYPQHTYMLLTKRPDRMNYFLKKRISQSCLKGIPNLWLGITAENQKRYDERWPILSKIPAAVKFVSLEPALERINIDIFAPWPDWVIWGPETGPGKRPFKDEWALSVYEQCQEKGIPFFDKTKKNWLAREFPSLRR